MVSVVSDKISLVDLKVASTGSPLSLLTKLFINESVATESFAVVVCCALAV
jgi:hypothetical protein